jgi:hypothetical protein
MITRLWSNYVWRNPQLEMLAFEEPCHDGKPIEIARQVYHRLVVRLAGINAYWRQWQSIGLGGALWVASWVVPHPEGGLFWGIWSFVGAFLLGVVLVPRLMRGALNERAKEEAAGVVRRCFLREVSAETPEDLKDVWRHGWITSQGRPISSEISEADARSGLGRPLSLWWFASIISFAAGLASWSGMEIMGTLVLVSAGAKFFFDKNPAMVRESELAAQEGTEGLAFVAAGGLAWSMRQEGARQAQIKEAERDAKSSPDGNLVELGRATGLLAARGDMFAPSEGLAFSASLRDLQTHFLVLGGTGSGKTTAVLKPLIYQAALWDGVGMLVMDGKGALPNELRKLKDGRLKVIDPAKVRVSLVAGVEPGVVIDTLIEILSGPSSGDRFWSDSAAALLRHAALIAHARAKGSWTLMEAARIAMDAEEAKEAITDLSPDALSEDPELAEAVNFIAGFYDSEREDTKLRDNIVAQARSWITAVTGRPELLAWADTKPEDSEVDIMGVLKGERIGVVIPAHRYGPAGAVATALLKARVYGGLKERADDSTWRERGETPVLFVIDEAQEVATGEDATMLAIGRSLGLAFVAATQTIEGVTERLRQSTAKWLGIFGGVIALGGRSMETDQFVAQRIGCCWMPHLAAASGMPVRTAIQADMMTGPHAAKRTQPMLQENTDVANWSALWSRATRGVAVAWKIIANGGNFNSSPHCQLGVKGLVEPGEVSTLVAEPNTALAVMSRARVIRRDLLILKPDYE